MFYPIPKAADTIIFCTCPGGYAPLCATFIPMKKGLRRTFKISAFTVLGIFLLINVIAFNHARRFTRYGEPTGEKRTRPETLSGLRKAGILLTGITNPKPQNDSVPHVPYRTVHMGTERRLEGWQELLCLKPRN